MTELPHALVTGGSRGIGAAICKELAAAGHPVLLNYRSQDAAAETVKAEIEAAGGTCRLLKFDVADRPAALDALATLEREGTHVGVLVNNAGIAKDESFPAMSWEAWSSVTRLTLDGFFNMTQPLVMPMV
ncbi:MAG: SDR family NAD(P)-dependent oxidoreductase, partial [Myxococcales bacterium]|nr:SDR family NAD(P)-dependent oxidoreductase [Myxococcales bacterium]